MSSAISPAGKFSPTWTHEASGNQPALSLHNPVRLSELNILPGQPLDHVDLTRNFVVDCDLDTGSICNIAARCIAVAPGVVLRSPKMLLQAPDGKFNFGRLDYDRLDEFTSGGYSAVEGGYTPGIESVSHQRLYE